MNQSKAEKSPDLLFRFLVVLLGVDPLVWRRIDVPTSYTFWDLHVAIQDAMGWQDYHLHEFRLNDPASCEQVKLGILLDDDPFGEEIQPGHLKPIADYFTHNNETALYTYDFGDGWRHIVAWEGRVWPEKGIEYPRCLSGKRKCPPEDCGGSGGYAMFLEAIQNPDHEEHEDYLNWIGGAFDPEEFEPKKVNFDDPAERWRAAFE